MNDLSLRKNSDSYQVKYSIYRTSGPGESMLS